MAVSTIQHFYISISFFNQFEIEVSNLYLFILFLPTSVSFFLVLKSSLAQLVDIAYIFGGTFGWRCVWLYDTLLFLAILEGRNTIPVLLYRVGVLACLFKLSRLSKRKKKEVFISLFSRGHFSLHLHF